MGHYEAPWPVMCCCKSPEVVPAAHKILDGFRGTWRINVGISLLSKGSECGLRVSG